VKGNDEAAGDRGSNRSKIFGDWDATGGGTAFRVSVFWLCRKWPFFRASNKEREKWKKCEKAHDQGLHKVDIGLRSRKRDPKLGRNQRADAKGDVVALPVLPPSVQGHLLIHFSEMWQDRPYAFVVLKIPILRPCD